MRFVWILNGCIDHRTKHPMISCYMQDLLARTLCLMILFNLVYFSLKKWLLTKVNVKTPKLSLYKVEATWSFLANNIFSNNSCTHAGWDANEPMVHSFLPPGNYHQENKILYFNRVFGCIISSQFITKYKI